MPISSYPVGPVDTGYIYSGEGYQNSPTSPSYPSYGGGAKMKSSLSGFINKGGTGQRTYYDQQIPCANTGLKSDGTPICPNGPYGSNGDLTDPIDAAASSGIFKNPGVDTIGNVGRNTYFGPGFFNADIAISKMVTFHESYSLKFRMDAFNGFNHINPGNPGGNIESTGTIGGIAPGCQNGISSDCAPRQLEFSLRFQF